MAIVSKKFIDLNPTFARNPLTGDVATLKNEDAVKQSLKNIITTSRSERPFMPFFGSGATLSLFEPFDAVTDSTVASAIKDAIAAYEPRVEVINVNVLSDIDNNSIDIEITFTIIGIPLDIQSLNLVLERV